MISDRKCFQHKDMRNRFKFASTYINDRRLPLEYNLEMVLFNLKEKDLDIVLQGQKPSY